MVMFLNSRFFIYVVKIVTILLALMSSQSHKKIFYFK